MFESHTETKKYLIFSAILMSQQKNCKVGETWVVDAKNYKLPDCFFFIFLSDCSIWHCFLYFVVILLQQHFSKLMNDSVFYKHRH